MTADLSPWATDQPPEPRSLSRFDRIMRAAHAMHEHLIRENPDTPLWRDLSGEDRDLYFVKAWVAVDAAYPELTTAAELDALPFGAVLIGPGGIAYERVVAPGNTLVRNPDRCWAQQAWATTRISSADLVRNGEVYVLVHRAAP